MPTTSFSRPPPVPGTVVLGCGGGTGHAPALLEVVDEGGIAGAGSLRAATSASTAAAVAALTPRLTAMALHLLPARLATALRSHTAVVDRTCIVSHSWRPSVAARAKCRGDRSPTASDRP